MRMHRVRGRALCSYDATFIQLFAGSGNHAGAVAPPGFLTLARALALACARACALACARTQASRLPHRTGRKGACDAYRGAP